LNSDLPWWVCDEQRRTMVNRASGEQVAYVGSIEPPGGPTGPWTWHRFDYLHQDTRYPLVVEFRRVAYAGYHGGQEAAAGMQLKNCVVYRVDHVRSAELWRRDTNADASHPSWGLWRRVDEAAIEAICCQPETRYLGPPVDEVALSGGWFNGEWRDALYRRQLNSAFLHHRNRTEVRSLPLSAYKLLPLDEAPAKWVFDPSAPVGPSKVCRPMMRTPDGRCLYSNPIWDRHWFSDGLRYSDPGLEMWLFWQPPLTLFTRQTAESLASKTRKDDDLWISSFRSAGLHDACGVDSERLGLFEYRADQAGPELLDAMGSSQDMRLYGHDQRQHSGILSRYGLWQRLNDCLSHAVPCSPGFDEQAESRGSLLGEMVTCCIASMSGGAVGGLQFVGFRPMRQIRLSLSVPNARGESDWRILFD
jgi:hypothetical protein